MSTNSPTDPNVDPLSERGLIERMRAVSEGWDAVLEVLRELVAGLEQGEHVAKNGTSLS